MNYAQLLEDVKQEVTRLFHVNDKEGLCYHNITHTQNVVANAGLLARHYKLDDKQFFMVACAAWFHDIGYNISGGWHHEQEGADTAAAFLKSKGVDDETIKTIGDCIMATHLPQMPKNLLEQIVCDADPFHLGTENFAEQSKQVRKEIEARFHKKISKRDWRQGTIKLFESHHYHTDYAHSLLDEKKAQNLAKLKSRQLEDEPAEIEAMGKDKTNETEKSEAKKTKEEKPGRGIETMFRISSANHQRLSDMADRKANIMITTTSIILSVLLSVMLRKLEDNRHLIIPTVIMLSVCVVTMVFAILATRPNIPNGLFTQEDLDNKKVNLLFFGNFYKMNFDEYNHGMLAMMNDKDFLYGSLTRDVYSQGVVLGRKYRLLRTGYNIFMFGIIVSVIAYLIAVVFFAH